MTMSNVWLHCLSSIHLKLLVLSLLTKHDDRHISLNDMSEALQLLHYYRYISQHYSIKYCESWNCLWQKRRIEIKIAILGDTLVIRCVGRYNVLKPDLHFERKSTAYTQTILRTWGAFSRPPMPICAVGIAQVPSVNTPTIRRLLRVDAGLSLANSPQPMRIRKLLRDI